MVFNSNPHQSKMQVEIFIPWFINFLTRDDYQVFKIKTNKKEYVCNIFSVYTSNVIHQILEKDPSTREFVYDFEDKNDEFQLICDFLNYKQFDLKNINIDSIKSIAEDLQINCILKAIDNYFDHCNHFQCQIQKHKEIIDKIDQLFDLLCNVKKYGVDKVKQQIVLSKWSKKERQVEELGAFIVQVIKGSFSLQREIAELVVGLNEESDDGNELKILLPFIVERLMTLYWPHPLPKEEVNDKNITRFSINAPMNDRINSETEEIINLTNKCVYSFIRLLYKRGVISKDDLYDKLKRYDLSNNALNAFFLPELIDIDPKKISEIESLAKTLKRSNVSGIKRHRIISLNFRSDRDTIKGHYYFWPRFAKNYLPDKIEMYEKMLDDMEPDDEMTKTIWKDDVDSLQRILSRDCKDMKTSVIPYNIFDDFEEEINLLNYSAFYGSIKCFKFLLLNQCEIDDNTFYYAVCGGNNEIIKIVDQQKTEVDPNYKMKKRGSSDTYYCNINRVFISTPFWFNNSNFQINDIDYFGIYITPEYDKYNDNSIQCEKYQDDGDLRYIMNCCNINNIIAPTIAWNKNDLFVFIFENVFVHRNKCGSDLKHMATLSASSGNIHSLISFFENGFKLTKEVICCAAKNGFYTLTQLLLDLYDENKKSDLKTPFSYNPFDYESIIHFGNLSIFEMFIDKMNQFDIAKAIVKSMHKNYTKIIKYVFDNIDKFNYLLYDDSFIKSALKASLSTKANELYYFLKEQFIKTSPELFNMEFFSDMLSVACLNSNLQVAEEITELILKENEKYDFTDAFFKASSSKSINICQYLLDKKVLIEFKDTAKMSNLGSIDVELFKIIMNNVDENARSIFYESIHGAISNKNKEVIELILKEQRPIGNELIESIKTDDVEIVDLILKYNSDASFVNQKTVQGPALIIAIKRRNLEIVKRLLCVPGIDLSLYDDENQTALGAAVHILDIEIVDLILNYYKNLDDQLITTIILNSTKDLVRNDEHHLKRTVPDIAWQIFNRVAHMKFIDVNTQAFDYNITKPILTNACLYNKIDFVKGMLDLNVDINVYEPESFNTPLMICLEKKYLDLAKIIINYPKTNINLRNTYNESAFTIAVKWNQQEIIDILLKDERFDPIESGLNYAFIFANKEISKQLYSLSCLDVNQLFKISGSGPINYKQVGINALLHSVEINDVDKIDMIIGHPSFDVYKSQVNKALFIAARRNNINVFQKLIKLIDNSTNIYNDNKVSLISYAAMKLSGDIVDAIIDKNDQICDAFVQSYSNTKNSTRNKYISDDLDYYMDRIMFKTIFEMNQEQINKESLPKKCSIIEMMERLVNYDNEHEHLIKFDKLLPKGKSFFTAICSDYSDIGAVCNFLIEHGVDPNTPDKDGIYPLEHAININSIDMVTSLVNSEKMNFEQHVNGSTYMHIAAKNKNSKILSLLLQKSQIDINSVNEKGETPLIEACKSKCIDNINLLFKNDSLDFLHCNKDGKDALDIILVSLPNEIESIRQNKEKYHNLLISRVYEMLSSNNE